MLLFEGNGLTYYPIIRVISTSIARIASSVVYHMQCHQSSVQGAKACRGGGNPIHPWCPITQQMGRNLESQASQRKGVAEACKACSACLSVRGLTHGHEFLYPQTYACSRYRHAPLVSRDVQKSGPKINVFYN
jgi:hypothetical protein